MNTNRLILTAGLAGLLLGACAAAPGDRPAGAARARGNACIFESAVSSFQPLSMTQLIIYGRGRDNAYLAEVSAGCFELKHRWALTLVDGDHNSQICGFGRDRVAYGDGGRVEQCQILALERLTPERLEALEIRHGLRKEDAPAAAGP